jgi:two-component system, NtrC family, sensor histidine kinase AtoS
MKKAGLFPGMALLRRRQPTLAEIKVLLDLFPQAALLVDLQLSRVLLANAQAAALTAFTRAELAALDLEALLPGVGQLPRQTGTLNADGGLPASMRLRNGSELQVLVNLVRLDPLGTWALASLEPAADYQYREASRQRQVQRLADLKTLVQAAHKSDLGIAIQSALHAGSRLTGAQLLAIYLLQPDSPGLVKTATWGEPENMPASIPAAEVGAVLEGGAWTAGKRANTSLQRAARAAGLAYLESVPLGEHGATCGALVVASAEGAPPGDEAALLEILAGKITTIIQIQSFQTNQIQEQARMQHSLAIGKAVLEVSHEGILVASRELTILEMNPSAEQVLGYASREITGQPVSNVLIGADNLVPALQSALQGIATPNLGNVRLHRRDGSAFLAHVQVIPVMVSDRLEAVVILLRDLSEHEQFQLRNEQLEQRALLGEVTAIFAHEVRNPINNLSTGLQLMAMNLPDDDPNQDQINRLNADLNRLTHLMQSVLSFSRSPENKIESVNLSELLPALLERWRPRLVRLNLQHRIQTATQKAIVAGDPRALEQVFNNLIGNAVQAMSDCGGTLSVHLRPVENPGDRPQVEISVSDDGPGIPEEIRERVFEPFFTTNRNGTGLGLAIARRIINKHKGTITVSSVPGGTAFQVTLPLVEVEN